MTTTDTAPIYFDTAIDALDCDDNPGQVQVTYSPADFGSDLVVVSVLAEMAALNLAQATQLRDALTTAIGHLTH